MSTPYIVKKLTPEVYGVYVLATSLMGLMSFLDLGFGQGIIKFVPHYVAKRDFERINGIIDTSLVVYMGMGIVGGVVILASSTILARDIFHISENHFQAAVVSFRIVGFGFLVTFVSAVFSSIPKALQRYDVAVKIQNLTWFFSVVSVVVVLYLGKGLVTVMAIYVAFQILGTVLYFVACETLLPTIRIRLKPSKDIFREIFGFSLYTAINSITGNLVSRFDKMIIGGFLGAEAVTYYQIPFLIVQMANGLVNAMFQFLFPAVSYFHALGEISRLRELYRKATIYVVSLALIITSGLVFLGKSFITIWMGQDFAGKTGLVMPIVATVFLFKTVSDVGYYFFNGLGKSQVNMISSLVGAICYLVGAVFIVPAFRLTGAAATFGFILVPLPYFFFTLVRSIDEEMSWHLQILAKISIFLVLIHIATHFISVPPVLSSLVAYGIVAIVCSVMLLFVLRIAGPNDIRDLKSKLKFEKALK